MANLTCCSYIFFTLTAVHRLTSRTTAPSAIVYFIRASTAPLEGFSLSFLAWLLYTIYLHWTPGWLFLSGLKATAIYFWLSSPVAVYRLTYHTTAPTAIFYCTLDVGSIIGNPPRWQPSIDFIVAVLTTWHHSFI